MKPKLSGSSHSRVGSLQILLRELHEQTHSHQHQLVERNRFGQTLRIADRLILCPGLHLYHSSQQGG
ncbi:hypothetical protein HanRHA438_Chr14g0657571 [Helianthus annuus]|nr:hypothetical protein HanRHA438_Chr14g0657571 [Helianthus annuus]